MCMTISRLAVVSLRVAIYLLNSLDPYMGGLTIERQRRAWGQASTSSKLLLVFIWQFDMVILCFLM